MQIAMTKKLADAMGINPPSAQDDIDPLFTWTANWTKVWDNRKAEDLLVLVNNATRFHVAVYQVKRKNLKNVAEMMRTAIMNTLLAMNLNPELVEEYLRLAGELNFAQNHDRKAASWVTKAGLECAYHIGQEYNGIAEMFSDTVGAPSNYLPIRYSNARDDWGSPYYSMINALSKLTGKQIYKHRAFELLVTLDLDVYKAVRRIIVPANLEFSRLHHVLQRVFGWRKYHLYDFTILDGDKNKPVARLVPDEDALEYDDAAILMKGHTLSEFFPKYRHMRYLYDLGDHWEHAVELVRVIEEHDQDSPYLLEAIGQTPPENVGGVDGFVKFRAIMMDPNHPEHSSMKQWVGYWTIDLPDYNGFPKAIHF